MVFTLYKEKWWWWWWCWVIYTVAVTVVCVWFPSQFLYQRANPLCEKKQRHDKYFIKIIKLMSLGVRLSLYLGKILQVSDDHPSSKTQGQSVGPREKARRKFSSTGGRAPGYRLSPDHFQTVKWMLAPDWAQKMLCIIVPNRGTASPEFFSWVRTRRDSYWLDHGLSGSGTKQMNAVRKLSVWYKHFISKYWLVVFTLGC